MERAVAEAGEVRVERVGTRCGELPHGRRITSLGRLKECREVHAIDVVLERGPA